MCGAANILHGVAVMVHDIFHQFLRYYSLQHYGLQQFALHHYSLRLYSLQKYCLWLHDFCLTTSWKRQCFPYIFPKLNQRMDSIQHMMNPIHHMMNPIHHMMNPIHHMMYPCSSYDGPETVPNQKVMNNSAIQWRIKKMFPQHSLNTNSLIHRLLKTRDIANLSKKGIHHIMYPIHHMMYPYPAYDVPLSIIWCTPIHHMMYPYPSYVAPCPS